MPEQCRVTLTFIAEFESDDPEAELAQLKRMSGFNPRAFIYVAESRGYHIEHDVYTERDL